MDTYSTMNNRAQAPTSPTPYPLTHHCSHLPHRLPPTYRLWSILSVLFFFPIGIAALIQSFSVKRLWMEGEDEEAYAASKNTRSDLIWTLIAGVLFWLLCDFTFGGLITTALLS